MEKKRIFIQDFASLDHEYNFKNGDVATIVKEENPYVTIKIEAKSYKLPYREFILISRRLD